MGFGYISKTLEIDLRGSDANKIEFALAVIQDCGPDDTGGEIKFQAVFEQHKSKFTVLICQITKGHRCFERNQLTQVVCTQ